MSVLLDIIRHCLGSAQRNPEAGAGRPTVTPRPRACTHLHARLRVPCPWGDNDVARAGLVLLGPQKGSVAPVGEIRIKRVYEPVGTDDGLRVLVDRVWPRGQSKEAVACDMWARSITPSTPLRKAFHAGALSAEAFAAAYRAVLENSPDFPAFVESVGQALLAGNVTLLTAARLVPNGHCDTLRSAILERLTKA